MSVFIPDQTAFLDGLELSVRANNVLRAWGRVHTLDAFLALDRATVMSLKNAGMRTWREIQQLQATLREQRTARPPTPFAPTLRDFAALAALPLAWDARKEGYHEGDDADMVRCAWQIADAFIAARDAKTNG